jgi:hypothetical protein
MPSLLRSDYNEYKSMFEQISKRLEVKTQSVDSLIKKKKEKSVKKVQQKIKYKVIFKSYKWL